MKKLAHNPSLHAWFDVPSHSGTEHTFLLGLVEAEPDIAIAEMQERLRTEAGIEASTGTIST